MHRGAISAPRVEFPVGFSFCELRGDQQNRFVQILHNRHCLSPWSEQALAEAKRLNQGYRHVEGDVGWQFGVGRGLAINTLGP